MSSTLLWSVVCLNMAMENDTPGQRYLQLFKGGRPLTLAVSELSVDRPQVGVLASNGAVFYSFLFSCLNYGYWTRPKRKPFHRFAE